jgi:serine/threonine-protein phosphatase PGAM5
MSNAKTVVLVRHGLSSWNAEGRVQGSSDKSVLSDVGIAQAVRVRDALSQLKFDKCFASPITRAKTSAELIWEGREEPLVYLDTLREANLMFLEGMLNTEAKEQYPELFKSWREDPLNFHVDGVYPVVELWAKAKMAWEEILSSPGERLLVVTHKSILRAMLCTALGLGPDRFRGVDVHNAGISTFTVNTRGEPMLVSLNRTAHLHVDDVHYLD